MVADRQINPGTKDRLLFGTGGTPLSARGRSTIAGIERIAKLGLDCMEVEFVQGVHMREPTARQVAATATRSGIALSVHAPYYINFNSREPDKLEASRGRLLLAARIAAVCGARSVVFHPGYIQDAPPAEVFIRIKEQIKEIKDELEAEGSPVKLRPEVTGKSSEFGTLDEVLRLCAELEGLAPCLDVAHWHARTGGFNSYAAVTEVLRRIEQSLGRRALDDMHFHFSGIKYGARGEIKHLNLAESDLNYAEILRAFKEYRLKGLVICESPNLEDDALLLQSTYLTQA